MDWLLPFLNQNSENCLTFWREKLKSLNFVKKIWRLEKSFKKMKIRESAQGKCWRVLGRHPKKEVFLPFVQKRQTPPPSPFFAYFF